MYMIPFISSFVRTNLSLFAELLYLLRMLYITLPHTNTCTKGDTPLPGISPHVLSVLCFYVIRPIRLTVFQRR